MILMVVLNLAFILIPVWGFVIWHLRGEHRLYYVICVAFSMFMANFLVWMPPRMFGVPYQLWIYALFMALYMAIIGLRYEYNNFFKVMAISMIGIFIAGEWWEIPVFVQDFLGKIGVLENYFTGTELTLNWWIGHIRRIYTLFTGIMFVKLTGMKINREWFVFLTFTTIYLFLVLSPITINGTINARIIALIGTGILTLRGLKDVNEFEEYIQLYG